MDEQNFFRDMNGRAIESGCKLMHRTREAEWFELRMRIGYPAEAHIDYGDLETIKWVFWSHLEIVDSHASQPEAPPAEDEGPASSPVRQAGELQRYADLLGRQGDVEARMDGLGERVEALLSWSGEVGAMVGCSILPPPSPDLDVIRPMSDSEGEPAGCAACAPGKAIYLGDHKAYIAGDAVHCIGCGRVVVDRLPPELAPSRCICVPKLVGRGTGHSRACPDWKSWLDTALSGGVIRPSK